MTRAERTVSLGLLLALAVQAAVPPFATDMYTPSFPQIVGDLRTSATMIGLTLTAFFVGMAFGQVVGGAVSDQVGRRAPLVLGALVLLTGSLVAMVAPDVGVLVLGRLLQGVGGGATSAVARAVLVDLTHGTVLARMVSLMMAITGLAPMIAPLVGGLVVTHATWRVVFAVLAGFAVVMVVTSLLVVPESLPPGRRHGGGVGRFLGGIGAVLRRRVFVAHMLTSAFSGFCMFAYISDSSFLLQGQKGLEPLEYSVVFATNAAVCVALTLVNSRLVAWVPPGRLVAVGLAMSLAAVALLAGSVLARGTPLTPILVGFLVLMGGQAFIFGNASALALGEAREHAGTGSALMGLTQSLAMSASAPLASSGGSRTSVPMVLVMVIGVSGAWTAHLLARRWGRAGAAVSGQGHPGR